jgi:polyhydroxyalkanoate synthesis regulator phasin
MDQKPEEKKPEEKKSVGDFFQQFWGQALTAVTGVEEEATKLLSKLPWAAGWSPEEARKQVRELSERLLAQRKDMERRVEEAVKASLKTVRVPRRDELKELSARVDALARRVESLVR